MTDVRGALLQVGLYGPHGPMGPHGPTGGGGWGTGPWDAGLAGSRTGPAVLLWLALALVVVAAVVYLARRVAGRQPAGTDAVAVLETRYARGEIDDEEFERRRERLTAEA